MNDSEIKDIDGIAGSASQLDKLKNLLIEFGVEFEEATYHTIHEIKIYSEFSTITFEFDRFSFEFLITCVD